MSTTAHLLYSSLAHPALVRGRFRALISGRRLPPGKLLGIDVLERADRRLLLDQAGRHGPVFKVIAYDQLWICVIGLAHGRRLLLEHKDSLRPVTMQLKPLIPAGFMRQMQAQTHRRYRRALTHALVNVDKYFATAIMDSIASQALSQYASEDGAEPALHRASPAQSYMATLQTIATGMLICYFFGAHPGSDFYDQLRQGYRELGPHGLVWNIGERQLRAFAQIRDCLLGHCALPPTPHGDHGDSVLMRLHRDGELDDTMLGNLIYMVEMGRYDTSALFRWLSKYAANHPDWSERIAIEPVDAPVIGKAFVFETLRMDQSERLLREVQRDLVFEGFLLPKGSMLRICLWESHKSGEAFAQPFEFRPERFLHEQFSADQYSPFGLDQHQCPLSGFAIRTALAFVQCLVRNYTVQACHDGAPIRGGYHWEPAADFSLQLRQRQELMR